MDAKFHPATSRSSRSHPTLLQCLVLDGKDKPHHLEMVQALIDAGAELNEPELRDFLR